MGIPPVVDGPYDSTNACIEALKKKEQEEQSIPSFLEQLRVFFDDPEFTFGEFKPGFFYHEAMDWLEYLEEDCCTVTDYQKGSNIALLRKWDGEKYCGIVGIKIVGFSHVAPPEVVEAFKAHNAKYRKAKKDV